MVRMKPPCRRHCRINYNLMLCCYVIVASYYLLWDIFLPNDQFTDVLFSWWKNSTIALIAGRFSKGKSNLNNLSLFFWLGLYSIDTGVVWHYCTITLITQLMEKKGDTKSIFLNIPPCKADREPESRLSMFNEKWSAQIKIWLKVKVFLLLYPL